VFRYQAFGYQSGEMLSYALAANGTMQFVPMRKEIMG
jgi:hypothetical protein